MIAVLLGIQFTGGRSAWAADPPSFEAAVHQLQAATVTIRVGPRPVAVLSNDELGRVEPRVTVFSGVSLGGGLVIAPLMVAADSPVRLTASDGRQAAGRPVVVDEHSGLALLEISQPDFPKLDLAEAPSKAGAWVLSAAAWGVEKPVVSLGIVSGLDRTLAGSSYPPLLQCDLRSAETSSGAAVVNQDGQLVGVVVAADESPARRGWTYAVPVDHVRRLLRARDQRPQADPVDAPTVVLKRRRPTIGMVLDGQPDRIVVTQVTKDSPAEHAGLQVGDRILAADGVQIRSVYQAVRPTLFKQPGDTVTFLVQKESGVRSVEVVLGGGVVVPGVKLAQWFEPKVIVDGSKTPGGREPRGRAMIGEVSSPANAEQPTLIDATELLEKALDRYRIVIEIQKEQLLHNEQQQAASDERVRQLESQLKSLQQQLDAIKSSDAGKK